MRTRLCRGSSELRRAVSERKSLSGRHDAGSGSGKLRADLRRVERGVGVQLLRFADESRRCGSRQTCLSGPWIRKSLPYSQRGVLAAGAYRVDASAACCRPQRRGWRIVWLAGSEPSFSSEGRARSDGILPSLPQLEQAWQNLLQLQVDKTFFDVKVVATNRGGAIVRPAAASALPFLVSLLSSTLVCRSERSARRDVSSASLGMPHGAPAFSRHTLAHASVDPPISPFPAALRAPAGGAG